MMAVILSRDHALTIPLLSTHGTATLLSKDNHEVRVPLAPLLGASTLVRSIVDESHLHPGIHGTLVLSFAVAADVLVSVKEILSVGESNVMEENIEEVKQVLNSLGVEANLSQNRINNGFEYVATNEKDIKLEIVFESASDEETPSSEGDVNKAMDNLLNVATNEENIKQEMIIEAASNEETLSEGDVSDVNDDMGNSLKECYVNIERKAEGSFNQSYLNKRVENTCNRSFPSDLEKRTRIPKGRKRHVCTMCNSTFAYSHDLRRHYRIHTGEKPFTCEICNLSFSQKGNLRIHERIHTREKPYSCKICSYSCSHGSDLKNHSRIHTGEKPFTCETCNSSFNHHNTLRNHKRIHTGEQNRGV